MTKKQELAKNTFIIMLGKISTQFLSFFLLPLYTWTLTKSELGTFDLITTYITLLVPIVTLQLENGVFRFLIEARNNSKKQKIVLSNTFMTLGMLLLITIGLFIILDIIIDIPYSKYILGNIIAYSLSGIALQICRGLGNNKLYSIGSFICGLSTFILSTLFLVVFKTGIIGLFISTILANIFLFIFVFVKLKLYYLISKKDIDKESTIDMLKYSIPLIVSGISWWIISASDKTIITLFLGASANGIYTVSSKFAMIYTSIYTIFNMSWTESAAVNITSKDANNYFNNVAKTTFEMFVALLLCMTGGIAVFFKVLINSSFNEAYIYIPILLIGTFFHSICNFLAGIFLAKKNSAEIAKTSLISAVLNVIINICLIKTIGLYAAAFSTVIALFVIMIQRYCKVQKIMKIKIPFKTFSFGVLSIALALVLYYIPNLYIHLFLLIMTIIISLILNKELLLNFKDIIKNGGKSLWKRKKSAS